MISDSQAVVAARGCLHASVFPALTFPSYVIFIYFKTCTPLGTPCYREGLNEQKWHIYVFRDCVIDSNLQR